MRQARKGIGQFLLACLCAYGAWYAPYTHAQTADLRTYNVAAQPLSKALARFMATSKTPVLFDQAVVANKKSHQITGQFTDLDAITGMLRGTGLGVRRSDEGVILIAAATKAGINKASTFPTLTPASAPPSLLPAVRDEPATLVVVTGFRGSLDKALNLKRRSLGTIDTIVAEDVSKFPNSNLAEALQRLPSVTLIIGDGGEGRNITVRGLGPMFSRVRIDGMEASALTGASDKFGPNNNSRSFDFNVFSTDSFSALQVQKTAASDVEEGSLGATIDLKIPKPFDFPEDRVFSVVARQTVNEVSQHADPRISMLFARRLVGGRVGVLASLVYQKSQTREVGYSAADVLSAGLGGNGLGTGATVQPFCTPLGYSPLSPDPVAQADKGTTTELCSTGNPRTGSLGAYTQIMALRSPLAPATPASGAYFPRLPRYLNSTQQEIRSGATLVLQYQPDELTEVGLDAMLTRYHDLRQDNYLEALSFARPISVNGQPMVSVKDAVFSPSGSLLYGLFDGVDVRSEGLTDKFSTTFAQINLNGTHRFSENFELSGLIGTSKSTYGNPLRLQLFMDAIDTKDFAIDFRGNNRGTPVLTFGGLDKNSAASFAYGPAQSDGTVLGGFAAQGKPLFVVSTNTTAVLNARWSVTPGLVLRTGLEFRQETFGNRSYNLVPSQVAVKGTLDLSALTTQISGLDKSWSNGAPQTWVAIDPAKWVTAVGFNDFQYCGAECGATKGGVHEITSSAYMMAEFRSDNLLPVPVQGNFGLRYFKTDQTGVGNIPVAAAAGAPYPTTGIRTEVARTYSDILPSANIVFDMSQTLLGRLSIAKVISRPDLYMLMPTATVNGITRLGTITNPGLNAIRANTFDASLEWYFKPRSLASAGYFHKHISNYIQRINTQVPFNQLGLPDALLDNTNSLPTDLFTISRLVNTPGGPLDGVELNLQTDFDGLPGALKNLGIVANYTYVRSRIHYVLSSADGIATATTVADLIGLSRQSASTTLYYEDPRFSARVAGTYKTRYIRNIPATSTGSDLQGNAPTLYVDASASWKLSRNLTLFVEAQNLTDEHNRQYVDSVRQDTLYDTRTGRTVSIGFSWRQ